MPSIILRLLAKCQPVLVIVLLSLPSYGADIFFAAASAGANNGTSCANAYAYTDGTNGFNTAGAQTAGNILHLCGTFTIAGAGSGGAGAAPFNLTHSGTSGNPITVKLETGALLQSTMFPQAGAIGGTANWIVIDGGTNGTIQNTLTGWPTATCPGGPCTNFGANNTNTSAVVLTGDNNTIKNVIVKTIYIHDENVNDNDAGSGSTGLAICGSNALIQGTTVSDADIGITNFDCTNKSTFEVSGNATSRCNHCVSIGIANGTFTGIKVHDNDFSNMYNWDEPNNNYHHNYIFTFGDPAGTLTGDYYNNYFHGISSRNCSVGSCPNGHTTAFMFLEFDNVGSRIFNNLMIEAATDNGPDNGFINIGAATAGTQYILNNTIVGGAADQASALVQGGGEGLSLYNNVFVNGTNHGQLIYNTPGPNNPFAAAGSVFFGFNSGAFVWPSDAFITLAQYSTDCTNAGHTVCTIGTITNPNLTADGHLNAGSPAIGTGTNLTSLGITALNVDKAGIPRPTVGNWDSGAYQFSQQSISPTSLGPWTITQTVSNTLTGSGFAGAITWSLLSGTPPNGLGGTCLTGTTGPTCTLTGTLSAVGTFPFTIRATDGTNTANQPYTVIVNAAPQVNPICPLPGGTVNVSYNSTGSGILTNTNGTPPFTWDLLSGMLPNGLSISGISIIGTPASVGTSLFTLRVTDTNGIAGTEACSLTITGVGTPASGGPSSRILTSGTILH